MKSAPSKSLVRRHACLVVAVLLGATTARAQVEVDLVPTAPVGSQVVAQYTGSDPSGNTSIANDAAEQVRSRGYFPDGPTGAEVRYIQRDRDIGQTFTYRGAEPLTLDRITVRTGFGTNVVRPGTYGAALSMQVYRVTGTATLNTNGTSGSQSATHGFPDTFPIPSERDDYLTGLTFTSMAVARGGQFPTRADFGIAGAGAVDPNDARLKGRYLQWDLMGDDEVTLMPGERYAFLLLIDQEAAGRGFTVANHFYGNYADGHGIRREGAGVFPPVAADANLPLTDPANAAALLDADLPADFDLRTALSPGTNGYPDVDTWRDLEFYVEARPIPEPAGLALVGAVASVLLRRGR